MKSESQFIILVSCVTLMKSLNELLLNGYRACLLRNRAVLERPSLRSLELQSNHILALIFCGGVSSEP